MDFKEIYLYSDIYEWTAESIVAQLEEFKNDPVKIRLNTYGGSVFAGWSIASKIAEHGNVTIVVDGTAMSMGIMIMAFAKTVECYDVAQFMAHKAFTWYAPSETDKAILEQMNATMKAKLKARIDANKFKEIAGISLDQMFDPKIEGTIDVLFTPKQAKEIGLVDKIIKLERNEAKAMFEQRMKFAASGNPSAAEKKDGENPKPQQKNPLNKMTLEEFKAAHPEIFAAAVAQGVELEKDRVGAWTAFLEIDPKAVAEGIASGKPIGQTAMANFTAKGIKDAQAAILNGGSKGPVDTAEGAGEKTEKEKEIADFKNEVKTGLGIKEKTA